METAPTNAASEPTPAIAPTPVVDAPPAPAAVPAAMPPVQSPPPVKIAQAAVGNPRQELEQLAREVAKTSSRKLLWEYLRLRSRVLAR